MKAFLHTFRYGIETTLLYHGWAANFNDANSVLEIVKPVLDDAVGISTMVTIVSGDEFTVAHCEADCELHGGGKASPAEIFARF